jgi:hypothetical protein
LCSAVVPDYEALAKGVGDHDSATNLGVTGV